MEQRHGSFRDHTFPESSWSHIKKSTTHVSNRNLSSYAHLLSGLFFVLQWSFVLMYVLGAVDEDPSDALKPRTEAGPQYGLEDRTSIEHGGSPVSQDGNEHSTKHPAVPGSAALFEISRTHSCNELPRTHQTFPPSESLRSEVEVMVCGRRQLEMLLSPPVVAIFFAAGISLVSNLQLKVLFKTTDAEKTAAAASYRLNGPSVN